MTKMNSLYDSQNKAKKKKQSGGIASRLWAVILAMSVFLLGFPVQTEAYVSGAQVTRYFYYDGEEFLDTATVNEQREYVWANSFYMDIDPVNNKLIFNFPYGELTSAYVNRFEFSSDFLDEITSVVKNEEETTAENADKVTARAEGQTIFIDFADTPGAVANGRIVFDFTSTAVSYPLATPTNVKWDSTIATRAVWNAVPNASSYTVQIQKLNASMVMPYGEPITGITNTYYDFLPVESGLYAFTVKAVGNGIIFTDSEEAGSMLVNVSTDLDSAILPTTASFDKYTGSANYMNIPVELTLNGNTLTSIKYGTNTLVPDAAYTVSGNTVTLLSSYLSILPVGAASLTFNFSGGASQTLTVNISDSTPLSSDSSLISVLEKTITAIEGNGTQGNPITANISVPDNVSTLGIGNIVTADNASVKIFTEPSYSDEVSQYDALTLPSGSTTDAYIEVIAQDGVTKAYYKVSITRMAKLSTPANPRWDETISNRVLWDPVPGATSYTLTFFRLYMGTPVPSGYSATGITNTYYDFTVSSSNTYSFTVTANGDGTTYTNSNSSAYSSNRTLSPIVNSTISPVSSDFDRYWNSLGHLNISVIMTLNGNTLANIKYGSETLVLSEDYFMSGGNSVILRSPYLSTLPVGSANLTFNFSAGAAQTLTVNITDSTPPSSEADLTKVLEKAIYKESGDGDEISPILANINVAQNVSSLAAGNIIASDNATVKIFTDSTFSVEIVQPNTLPLTAGDTTSAYIEVTAQDSVTKSYYIVSITRAAQLNPPATFGWDMVAGGVATWSQVNGAVSYTVQLYWDGNAYAGPVTVTTNYFDFNSTIMVHGDFSFKVKANGDAIQFTDSDETDMSEEYAHALKLATPESPRWDQWVKGRAVWNSVHGAVSYTAQLYRNGIAYGGSVTGITTSYFDFASSMLESGTYTFKVKAVGDGVEYKDSDETAMSVGYTHTIKLSAPSTLGWDILSGSGIAVWGTVNDAASYTIQLYRDGVAYGGPVTGVTATYYDLNSAMLDPGSYTFKIKAIGNGTTYSDSDESAASGAYIHTVMLDYPTYIGWDQTIEDRAKWDAIANASGYNVQLYKDGTEFGQLVTGVTATYYDFASMITEPGSYTFKVRAIGNGTTYTDSYESLQSGAYAYSIVLTVPTNIGWAQGVNGRATWDPVAQAGIYHVQLYKDGMALGTTKTVFVDTYFDFGPFITEAGSYSFRVRAVGDGPGYVDSNESSMSGAYIHSVTLDAPIYIGWAQAVEGRAVWDMVADASGYDVQLYKDGTAYGELVTGITETYFDFGSTLTEPGSYAFKVRAIGNGTTYNDSDESALSVDYNYTVALDIPTNIGWDQAVEGRATWYTVTNASGYNIQLYKDGTEYGELTTGVIGNYFDFGSTLTEPGSYTFKIRAIGNGTEYTDSDESFQSGAYIYTLTLDIPTNIGWDQAVEGRSTWGAVINADSYTLQLYKDGTEYGELVTGIIETYFDVTTVITEPGSYTFKIRAIGNGTEYTDSDESFQSGAYIYTLTLDIPTNIGWDQAVEGRATWYTVTNASGYNLQLYKDGTEYGELTTGVIGNYFDFGSTLTEPGSYTFKVRAIGNGTTYSDSDESSLSGAYNYTVALDIPTNIGWDQAVEGRATWYTVTNASGYNIQLYKDGTEYGELTTGVIGNYFDFGSTLTEPGSYTFKVRAIGNGTEYTDSDESSLSGAYIYTLTLDIPTNIGWDQAVEGRVTWYTVANASGYNIQLYKDGTEYGELITGITETYFDFGSTLTEPGSYTFKVRAIGNGTEYTDSDESSLSGAYIYTLTLDIPTNIGWDQAVEGRATWYTVTNASGYNLQLYKDGTEYGELTTGVIGNYFDFGSTLTEPGSYTFKIRAIGNGITYSDSDESSLSGAYIYTLTLDIPTNIGWDQAVEGRAVWDMVADASGYDVQLYKDGTAYGEMVTGITETYFDFGSTLTEPGSYAFKVRAIGNGTTYNDSDESSLSGAYNYTVALDIPTNIGWDQAVEGRATWYTVTNASGYNIQLYKDGTEYGELTTGVIGNYFDFGSTLIEPGSYTFKIRAIGNGTTYSDSDESSLSGAYIYTLTLDIPTNIGWDQAVEGRATWYTVTNASGYNIQLYKDGTEYGEMVTGITETYFDFGSTLTEPGSYTFKIRAIGNGTTYSDSDESSLSGAYNYTVALDIPTNIGWDQAVEGRATWYTVANASGYNLQLYKDGTEYGELTTGVIGNYFDFGSTLTEPGSYTFKVRAIGNGTEYTDSDESSLSGAYIYTLTLDIPTNIGWDQAVEGRVTWYTVANASGYNIQLYKDGTEYGELITGITETYFDFGSTLTEPGSYTFKVRAIGNGTEYTDSDESSLSGAYIYTLTLDIPTNIGWDQAVEGRATWYTVTNASGYNLQLYKDGTEYGELTTGVIGNYFDFGSTLTEPGSYTFKVRAIGNGTTYSDSDESSLSGAYNYTVALDIPTNIGWDQAVEGRATWHTVSNASGYNIQLYKDGTEYGELTTGVIGNYFDFGSTLTEPGSYTFKVRAIGNGTEYTDSDESSLSGAYIYTLTLDIPTNIGWDQAVEGRATWGAVINADSYTLQLYKDGTEYGELVTGIIETYFDVTTVITEFGNYTFKVRAIGNGLEYVNSDESSLSVAYTHAAKLEVPGRSGWSDSIPGKAEWDAVDNASSYTVQLYKDGVPHGEPVTGITSNYFDFIPFMTEPGSYTFKVKAIGNGTEYSYSDESSASEGFKANNVSFVNNYGGSDTTVYTTQVVLSGNKATAPVRPVRKGYIFRGWYADSNGTEPWSFTNNEVTETTSIYAKWTSAFFVSYGSDNAASGVTPTDNTEYSEGSLATVKGNTGSLARPGYTFSGWSYNNVNYTPGMTLPVLDDISFTPVWTAEISSYKVSFDRNYIGGSTLEQTGITFGSTLVNPEAPVREGYTFTGWYKEASCVNRWNFSLDAVKNNITLYAGWVANTYSVAGTIRNDQLPNPAPVAGITVKVMQGAAQLGADITTGEDGSFTLSGLPEGIYNLVISNGEKEVTGYFTLSGGSYSFGTITFPSGNKSSRLDVKGADTPNVVVDGLHSLFNEDTSNTEDYKGYTAEDRQTINDGGIVEIRLTVQKNDNSENKAMVLARMDTDGYVSEAILDVDLIKTSTKTNDETKITAVTETETLLKIIIPLSAQVQGKSGYVLYRAHGAGSDVSVDAITTTPNDKGEYIEVSGDKKQITAYLRYFSTYVVGYEKDKIVDENETNGSGSSSTVSFTVTASAGEGGSISPSGNSSVVRGQNITYTVTPNDGYEIADILVDGISVGVMSSYTFSGISSAHTIKAEFKKRTGGLPYYLDENGKKVFIGFSAEFDGEMKYLAPADTTVLFEDNSKDFSDINGHWAKASIDFITRREIFVGTGGNLFVPNDGMTRGMFAAVIGRLYERSFGELVLLEKNPFTDVASGSFYERQAAWASENGIIYGIGHNKFDPDRKITREEMAVILYRFAKFMDTAANVENKPLKYTDASQISSWAVEAAAYCQETGLIAGNSVGGFAPKNTATRAEVASLLERFVKLVLNQ